ncbi:MAG: T9SS type A sorting domain-containing protein [Dokdonia sp.]|jgi:hypothetical protein
MKTKKLLTILLLLVSVGYSYSQCSMIPKPLDQRIADSRLVIEGEVIKQQGIWNDAKTMIHTINTIKVSKVFKGEMSSSTVDILTQGGTVGLTHDRVSVALKLHLGDIGVFTLRDNSSSVKSSLPLYEVLGRQQGFIAYSPVDGSAADFQSRFSSIENELYPFVTAMTRSAYREIQPLQFTHGSTPERGSAMMPVISSFTTDGGDTVANAGVGELLTINGSGFGTTNQSVFFSNADSGGANFINVTTQEQIQSWTDTQIILEVPSGAGTGEFVVQVGGLNAFSGSDLTVDWNHLNVTFDADGSIPGDESWEVRLINDNGAGGYDFNFNDEFNNTAGAPDTYEDLITTWRCETGVNFIRGDDTTNDVVPLGNPADGLNIVRFDNGSEINPADGTLAYALSRFSGCFLDATTVSWHVAEIDVVVNDDFNWYYDDSLPVPGSQYDFETVILHEIGHGHGMGHVINLPQVMHFSIGTGTAKRTLNANDLDAGSYIMAKSTSIVTCGQSVMQVATPTAVCRDITISLDANGEAVITPDDIDNGSTPDCLTISSLTATKLSFDCSDIGTQNITLTVNFSDGSSDTCVAAVTVEGTTATYQAGAWVGGITPDGSSAVTIDDNLDVAAGNIRGCSCEITTGNTLTIGGDGYLETFGDITVNGSLIVEHEGSVVQKDNAANVIKGAGATIEVQKTTPTLAPLGFMFLSSPMTTETRDGVYSSAFRVIDIVSSNFVVDPALETSDPMDPYFGAEIFLGPNNSFLSNYTGSENLAPGEGLVVYPQSSVSDGGSSYDFVYEQGVLNNGLVSVPIQYNGQTKNNFNLLGNPYPSAIDADALIAANDMIGTVYFWEHLTAPSTAIPGYLQNNYSMNDISLYNISGGVAAANGGTAPTQFIASGQGFAIKAMQGMSPNAVFNNEMRVTGNNDQYRNTQDRDRVWVSVTNQTYGLKSQMLLAFSQAADETFNTGYDSKRVASAVSLFTTLKSGEQLAIQTRESFDAGMAVGVGFATAIEGVQEFEISIDKIEGVNLTTNNVYLVDTYLGSYVNLKDETYTFSSNRTMSSDRFKIVFEQPEILSVSEAAAFASAVQMYPNPTLGDIEISYTGSDRLTSITVIDLQGKIVEQQLLSSASVTHKVPLSKLASGVYFVTISGENHQVVRKLIKQ